MAITRSQMRRQLYRGGGIASVPRRQKYGLGGITQIGKPGGLVEPGISKYGMFDFITDPLKKVGERVRKIIPNEIANFAAKAAPFVAPFNPLAAGLMRGVGRYDKRGSLSDALKQGVMTYAGGQAARYLGGADMQTGFNPMSGMGPAGTSAWSTPIQPGGPIANTWSNLTGGSELAKEKAIRKAAGGEGLGKGTGLWDKAKGAWDAIPGGRLGKMGAVFAGGTGLALLADKIAGPKKPDETMQEYMTRRKSSVGEYLRFYYKRTNPLAGETEVQDFVDINTKEYASGGRVGYNIGSPREDLDAGAESIVYEGNMDPNKQMASDPSLEDSRNEMSLMLFGKPIHELNEQELELLNEHSRSGNQQSGIMQAAKGGRIGYNIGMGPAGLPGAPRMAPDGIEYDMRAGGGFQPLGAQEGKDDVNAKLAKNEFVFTADAVRAAGGGSVQKGAQRMYDTMKRLESRVA